MLKRVISVIVMLTLLPYVSGCTVVEAVDLTGVTRPAEEKIYGVITLDGERVDFDQPTTEVRNDTIYASVDQVRYSVPLDQVQELRLRRTSIGRTALLTVGVLVFISAVAVVACVATNCNPLGTTFRPPAEPAAH